MMISSSFTFKVYYVSTTSRGARSSGAETRELIVVVARVGGGAWCGRRRRLDRRRL